MNANRSVFQKAFDALIEARSRQAARFVAEYSRQRRDDGERLTRR
jgi:hypothetical protein